METDQGAGRGQLQSPFPTGKVPLLMQLGVPPVGGAVFPVEGSQYVHQISRWFVNFIINLLVPHNCKSSNSVDSGNKKLYQCL